MSNVHTRETYTNVDDAIAAALSESGHGDIVVIHEAHCREELAPDYRCTCKPMELVVGAAS